MLSEGESYTHELPADFNAFVYARGGAVTVGDSGGSKKAASIKEGQLAVLSEGTSVTVQGGKGGGK